MNKKINKNQMKLKEKDIRKNQKLFSDSFVYLSPDDYQFFKEDKMCYLLVQGKILLAYESPDVAKGEIGIGGFYKRTVGSNEKGIRTVNKYRQSVKQLKRVRLKVDYQDERKKDSPKGEGIDSSQFNSTLFNTFNKIPLSVNQRHFITFNQSRYFFYIIEIDPDCGVLSPKTEVKLEPAQKNLLISSDSMFKKDFSMKNMKIGGLDKQLEQIFTRIFFTRTLPQNIVRKFSIKHIKGIILYGPPGSGKTLIARELSNHLTTIEPKIVQGPQLLDKFVGEGQRKVRELFEPAEQAQRILGDKSPLHVIIFDEFDSLARHRGSSSSGVNNDTIVNQLLTKIDGIKELDNILVIGLTNRIDLIDEAIKRPGRFEVHIEIGLPDKHGRIQILNVHTNSLLLNKLIHNQVDFESIAEEMENYTGAEIEAVTKNAKIHALTRGKMSPDFSKQVVLSANTIIRKEDFTKAIQDIRPQFGADQDKLNRFNKELIDYGQRFFETKNKITKFLNRKVQNKTNNFIRLKSLIVSGPSGCGKTNLVVNCCRENKSFTYLKILSPESMLGLSEEGKIQFLIKIFFDAYRTKLSCIIIDNVQRIIEFVSQGYKFNNIILQTLINLLRSNPGNDSKLFVIATTSKYQDLKALQVAQIFNETLTMQQLNQKEIQTVLLKYFEYNPEISGLIAKKIKTISLRKLLQCINSIDEQTYQAWEEYLK